MDDDVHVIISGKGNHGIVASKSSINTKISHWENKYCYTKNLSSTFLEFNITTNTMSAKGDIIFHKRFKIVSMVYHVFDSLFSVEQVVIRVSFQLVTKCSKQTVST